ncbi:MAG: hypothetical protein R2824_23205 [Saprospiraceae bacterium]
MKTKLVLWGTNAEEERVLVALELRPKENKVDVYTFPETVADEAFYQKMMQDWRDGNPMDFPEDGYTRVERELTITESILPDDIKVERGDLVQRAQAEWHFVVLSSKLSDAYHSELAEIRDRIERLDDFDDEIWTSLKDFWNKVQSQVRERNLFRDHADQLRDKTNELFSKMKQLRAKLDEEFKENSKANLDRFMSKLEEVEQKIKEGLRFQGIFDELKDLQRRFRNADFTREHRSKVWERIDTAFKTVKERKFGSDGGKDHSPVERIERRYEGLIAAMGKMKRSIERDEEELAFQNRRIATTDGQLEAQIRQAKIVMIEERIRSKQEKYKEMERTKADLEKRMESAKAKEAKRLEQEKLEEAKRRAQEKIAEEIRKEAESRVEDEEKLEKAAEALFSQQPVKEEEPATKPTEETPKQKTADGDTLLGAVGTTLGEVMEDAVDTFKAIATVVGGQIGEALEDLKEKAGEVKNDLQEELSDAIDNVKEKFKEEEE